MKSIIFQYSRQSCCLLLSLICTGNAYGQSEVLKWKDGKTAAISITYDGGTKNQFRVALPIMNEMGLPATFYIVTGDITGAQYRGEFIGRDVAEIVEESKTVKTNLQNLFERAAAVRYLQSSDARLYHTRAGDLFELGKADDACREIDRAFAAFSKGVLKMDLPGNIFDNPDVDISWDEIKQIATAGHEFGSHSVTHPQLGIYDFPNMRYEIEKSREEIVKHLGESHTFSAEIPHGIENPRVMEFAGRFHEALRNRMPARYLEEINRWSRMTPSESGMQYIQWQRGPKSSTSLKAMNAWVDTCLAYENVWLVLTFHGVDGIGYEPKSSAELREFFSYIKSFENRIWIATFRDVVKYIRQRDASSVTQIMESSEREDMRPGKKIVVGLKHNLDKDKYNYPLTLKSYMPQGWNEVSITQGGITLPYKKSSDKIGSYVIYNALPNKELITIEPKAVL
ncbi:MAG: polysaccharide deacetylase [Bacteroidetes bacterium HGW-Bacteroidetes-8]|nr:MAG: polysaccharide deacetylase [Bacteroidetes bacterium HGW-Bacteroidetes-8]